MKVTLYKSAICPRCYLAHKYLREELPNYPAAELELVDIVTAPATTLQAGVKMIPAIIIGKHKLSSVFLNRKQVSSFLREHLSNSAA